MNSSDVKFYLENTVKLDSSKRYEFIFDDGTGFFGLIEEFAEYAERRYKNLGNEFYEIEDSDFYQSLGYDVSKSYEIYPPSFEGEAFNPGKKDFRF